MKKNVFTRILAIALVAMSIMAVSIPALAATYTYNGSVSRSVLPIYANTNTNSTIKGYYSQGDDVSVTTCNNKAWFKVNYNNETGYVRAQYIGILTGGYASAVVHNPNGSYVYLYSTPGNSSTGFKKLYNADDIVVLHESYGDYTRVSDGYQTGWILDSEIYYG